MSFWENNKDSIKAGSIATLKGAGRATKAVGKAGYQAAKNHNNKKKGTANDSSEHIETAAPVMNYQDPKDFPPPPKHVAAHGVADPMPGLSHSASYRPPPYPQQPSFQTQQSLETGQNPPQQLQQQQSYELQGQKFNSTVHPMQLYQQQPLSFHQLSPQNPYQLQPQVYQQPHEQAQSYQQQPQAYQHPLSQPPQNVGYQSQPQPQLQTYQAPSYSPQPQVNQQPPQSYQSQTQTQSQHYQQQSSQPNFYQHQQPVSDPCSLQVSHAQLSETNRTSTPPDVLTYNHPYHSQPPPLPSAQSNSPAVYGQPAVPLPMNLVPQPQPLASPVERSLPPPPYCGPGGQAPAASASVYQVCEQTRPAVSKPGYVQPPVQSIQSEAATVDPAKERRESSDKPGKEIINEPNFKTNLMDFDITKFGAPPPKARLNREEEIYNERRKQEKIRLQQIKEQSLQKARETSSKYTSAYNSPAARSNSNIDTISTYSTSTTSIAGSFANSAAVSDTSIPPPPPREVSSITTSPPPAPFKKNSYVESPARPGTSKSGSKSGQPQSNEQAPKGFILPDISQFQPPPLTHPRPPLLDRASENSFRSVTTPTNNVAQQNAPPLPPVKHSERERFPSPPLPIPETDAYTRSQSNIPVATLPHKKVPPPKPIKLSSDELSSVTALKQKKSPPPKPSKPVALSGDDEIKARPPKPSKPVVLSSYQGSHVTTNTATGIHIKELQQRLGNLQL